MGAPTSGHAGGFHRFAAATSRLVGSPQAFAIAIVIIVVWGLSGPLFGFSDTWQLVINTGTTIVTFLVVFLIQNSQNRESFAMNLKLSELLRANEGARNSMVNLEDLSDAELFELHHEFELLQAKFRLEGQPVIHKDDLHQELRSRGKPVPDKG